MAINYFKKEKNLAEQLLNIKITYTTLSSNISKNVMICSLKVKPTEYSKEYVITIQYDAKTPKVFLYNQGILKNSDEIIPHIYKKNFVDVNHENVQICLYYPKYKEWDKSMYIASTIIPWAIEWLYYYELWRITGKWLGKDITHEKSD